MATLPSSILPHIDLTNDPKALEPGTPQWEVTCQTIRRALETHGCFAVEYEGVTCEERAEMFAEMESLFDLPTETKKKVESLPHPFLRLPERNPESPLRQAIGLRGLQMPETAQALTDLMWPHGNHNFCQTINSISKKMKGLAITLARMVLHSYGLDGHGGSELEDADGYLVMSKFSAPMIDKPTLGVSEHVDLSFLTILFQNCVDGLLTKSRNGDWLQVIPRKYTFVVMTGLLLKVWSNGRIHVPQHKVDIRGSNDRLSCLLFLGAPNYKNDQLIVEVPHELVDEDHPPLFKPFQYEEFKKYYVASGFAEDSLDKFAGI